MPTVTRSASDLDRERVAAAIERAKRIPDDVAERVALEEGGDWTEAQVAGAALLLPAPTAEQVKALRVRLGLSQAQFARRFGLTVIAVQQYEQGRRRPRGAAATLLRVIVADPEAVARALAPRTAAD